MRYQKPVSVFAFRLTDTLMISIERICVIEKIKSKFVGIVDGR